LVLRDTDKPSVPVRSFLRGQVQPSKIEQSKLLSKSRSNLTVSPFRMSPSLVKRGCSGRIPFYRARGLCQYALFFGTSFSKPVVVPLLGTRIGIGSSLPPCATFPPLAVPFLLRVTACAIDLLCAPSGVYTCNCTHYCERASPVISDLPF